MSFIEYVAKEAFENQKVVGEYGIPFLDDYLGGIRKSDMVLLGADTGCGKSTLAYQIAHTNALNKKKVHLFALEADRHEADMKQAYSFIADMYFNKKKKLPHIQMNYRNYSEHKIDLTLFEPELTEYMDRFHNLTIHYKDKEFTIDTLIKKFNEVYIHCDMIILDHIDYFDIIGDNENSEVTEILKELRGISLDHNIPVIILSHLRKSMQKRQSLPHREDFMGTSNKTKITKTSILLSPHEEDGQLHEGMYPTIIQIPKDRMYGRSRTVAKCVFDASLGTYIKEYELFTVRGGEIDEPVTAVNLPPWAKRAKEVL